MSKKGRAVNEIIKKVIEPNGIYLNLIRGGHGFKYEFKGKKINIKTVSDKGLDRIWLGVTINDLKDMNFFIFGWFDIKLTYVCAYVIPSDFLREKLDKHGRKNKSGRGYNFHIKVGDVLFLNREHKYPINNYKNKFSILK